MSEQCKQPYTFIPVVTGDAITHEAVFHNGKDNQNKLTGTIQCTLTVKSPMIVGHFQYTAESIEGLQNITIEKVVIPKGKNSIDIIKAPKDHVVIPQAWGNCGYPQQNKEKTDTKNNVVHKDKTILEPLFTDGNADKSILLSGTSLKGMIRHTIGAITNSPMERVEEKQFSYRPGIVYKNQRQNTHYKLYEATANETLDQDTTTLTITISDESFKGRNSKIELNKMLIEAYRKTIKTYTTAEGQNKKRQPKGIKGRNAFAISTDDTIFIEYDTINKQVVSFGNHEQYRWIYADTTTQIQQGSTGEHEPRPETHRLSDEIVTNETAQLSATRSLFGYVDGGDSKAKDGNLNLDIGKDDYSRLAGRISINTAVEVLTENTNRFLKHNDSYNIPLRILSEPKASAVECYLDQSTTPQQGTVNTYGDFPGFEPSGIPLSGRKFYYRWRAQNNDFALSLDDSRNDYKDCIALAGKQASIARYVSSPETQFKFTLRFKDLSEAELGAILTALSPSDAAENTGEHWQQVGHGRPLGMGSVEISIDKISLIKNDLQWTTITEQKTAYINTFKESSLCFEKGLKKWLTVCRPGENKTYMDVKKHGGIRQQHIKRVRNAN